MKAAIVHKNGDPKTTQVLSVDENVDKPTPKHGELLIKVCAAAINPVDWKLITGDFPGLKKGPVGFDVSGVVESIGPDTTETSLKIGDEIYADCAPHAGTWAEYVTVPEHSASPKPKNINFQEAAAMPLVGLTAYQGLVTHGNLESGQKVAILGGSSGVGSLAIQIAKAMGASEIYATGSSVDMIKELGADVVINYKEQSVEDELKGKELDIVFDCVGGIEGWRAAQGALKKDGKFVTIVGDNNGLVKTMAGAAFRMVKSMFPGTANYKIFLTSTKPPAVTEDMKKLTKLVEAGKVKPILDGRSFELTTEGVHEMIEASMSHRAKGKLILNVNV